MADGKGLSLLVHPNGLQYWRLKYRYAEKEKQLALGVYPEIYNANRLSSALGYVPPNEFE